MKVFGFYGTNCAYKRPWMYFLYENKLFLQMSFNLSSRELYFERFIQKYSQISSDANQFETIMVLFFNPFVLDFAYKIYSHTWYFNSGTIKSIKR